MGYNPVLLLSGYGPSEPTRVHTSNIEKSVPQFSHCTGVCVSVSVLQAYLCDYLSTIELVVSIYSPIIVPFLLTQHSTPESIVMAQD